MSHYVFHLTLTTKIVLGKLFNLCPKNVAYYFVNNSTFRPRKFNTTKNIHCLRNVVIGKKKESTVFSGTGANMSYMFFSLC